MQGCMARVKLPKSCLVALTFAHTIPLRVGKRSWWASFACELTYTCMSASQESVTTMPMPRNAQSTCWKGLGLVKYCGHSLRVRAHSPRIHIPVLSSTTCLYEKVRICPLSSSEKRPFAGFSNQKRSPLTSRVNCARSISLSSGPVRVRFPSFKK